MSEAFFHQPVMLVEVLEGLQIVAGGTYIDCTFGRGGHSREILKQLNSNGRLLAIDQDQEAITYGRQHFSDPRLTLFQGSFAGLETLLAAE